MSPSLLFGVFDGHGGRAAATFLSRELPRNIALHLRHAVSVEQALERAFHQTDADWVATQREKSKAERDESGSVATIALCFGRELFVASAGDTRAVISRNGKAVAVTKDHTPNNEQERHRLREAGAYVDQNNLLGGEIAVSRSVGDINADLSRIPGLIPTPEVHHVSLRSTDEFLIIACDGLWDVVTTDRAVKIARESLKTHNDPQRAAEVSWNFTSLLWSLLQLIHLGIIIIFAFVDN